MEHEKDMRDKEREKKEMMNDIEKLVKLVDKLKRKVNVLKGKEDGELCINLRALNYRIVATGAPAQTAPLVSIFF